VPRSAPSLTISLSLSLVDEVDDLSCKEGHPPLFVFLVRPGEGFPKLAEYNADTPTVLIESGPAQAAWCREARSGEAQFNAFAVAGPGPGESDSSNSGDGGNSTLQGQPPPPPLGALERAFAATARPGERFVFTSQAHAAEDGAFLEESATARFVCGAAKRAGLPAAYVPLEDARLQSFLGERQRAPSNTEGGCKLRG